MADWSAAICPAATLDDLDPDAVATARASFQAKNQDKAFARDMDSWSTETFLLFDDSKPGGTRKIVARNHQVLGVNNAVASVLHQEELKKEFPPEKRLAWRVVEL